ncbi:P-loop containing nucleoside triphosphate hydrolase protein [Ilyonectria destructans]|nr:P-loop containing nucleoside triphosphate hydrolase protein [Ilyonectria destructans]
MSTQDNTVVTWPPTGAVVVMVMGITGVGKSTFISKLTGEDVGIGHELTSYTKGVGIYSIELEGKIVYLVDTPGFNDTWRSDADILKEIAFIMSRLYRQGMRLAGILNLHRISDNRVTGSSLKSFNILQKLCGPEGAARVFLVTTMWQLAETGKLNPHEAQIRELRLTSTPEFWGCMHQQGSQIKQWRGNESSALSIIRELIDLNEKEGYLTQQIQREIVDEKKRLQETSAGQELWTEWKAAETEYAKKLTSLQRDGAETQADYPTTSLELRKMIDEMRCAQEELQVTVEQLFKERGDAYTRVLSQIQLQQQHAATDLDDKKRHFDRLAADRDDTEALLNHEVMDWESRRQILHLDELNRRRTKQSLEWERSEIVREEMELREQYEELLLTNEISMEKTSDNIDKLRKRDVMKRNLLPLLGILAGTGMAIAGSVTGLIPLAGAGIGVGFTSASKINFSRRLTPDLSLGKKSSNFMLEPLCSGGQGAAGASLN